MLRATRLIERTAPKKPMAMRAAVEQSVELLAIRVLVSTPWGAPGDLVLTVAPIYLARQDVADQVSWPSQRHRRSSPVIGQPHRKETPTSLQENLPRHRWAQTTPFAPFSTWAENALDTACSTAWRRPAMGDAISIPRGVALYTHHEQLCPPGTKWRHGLSLAALPPSRAHTCRLLGTRPLQTGSSKAHAYPHNASALH